MQTDCSTTQFNFGVVDGRRVEARFDGGTLTSDAGALLLGRTDKALRLVERELSNAWPIASSTVAIPH